MIYLDCLREHIPLKQGLRLSKDIFVCISPLREHIPLKQGLRPPVNRSSACAFLRLREHIPLKQGLRPFSFQYIQLVESQRAYSTKTRIKTHYKYYIHSLDSTQRAYSTKTRIKTCGTHTYQEFSPPQRAYSTKTRIKTMKMFFTSVFSSSESIFH